MQPSNYLICFYVCLNIRLSQLQGEHCTPLETNHFCYQFASARNTSFSFSEYLPDNSIEVNSEINSTFGEISSDLANNLLDQDCVAALFHSVCLSVRPPCTNTTGHLLPICHGSCLAFKKNFQEGRCDSLLQLIEGFFLFDLLTQLDCTNPSTYYFFDNLESRIDTEECTHLIQPSQAATILSRPNMCAALTASSICDQTSISQFSHYIPLRDRNTTRHLELLEQLFVHENISENCRDSFISLGCYYTFPPCDSGTGLAFQLSLESCASIVEFARPCLDMIMNSELTNFTASLLFNCSDTSSYLPEFIHINNSEYHHVNESVQLDLPLDVPSDVIAVGVIVGAVVGTGLFLILLIILLLSVLVALTYWRKSVSKQLDSFPTAECEKIHRINSSEQADIVSPTALELTDMDKSYYEKFFSSILLPYTSLSVGEEIGQGAFGKVYRGEIMRPGSSIIEDVAIKIVKHVESKNEILAFFQESLLMKDFNHPNILGLAGVCVDTPDYVPFIITPFMINGSLKDYLRGKRINITDVETLPEDLNISTLVRMCMDIAHGMEYLADRKFVHRDLAARNCMVDGNLSVKVGDFGLARDIYSRDYYRANQGAKIPVKWMAPETITDAISNQKTDVWSYGVVCWEVFSLGRGPYPGIHNQDILRQISTDSKRLERPSLCSAELYDLTMSQCWRLLPEERPTFSQLVYQLREYWEEHHAYVVENLEN